MFDYYTIVDSEQIRFYQLPLELVKHQRFKVLSDSAKILYSLLRDRVSLSAKNNWVDEYGRIYIIFTITEIMEDLGCADQKATKAMKELQKLGLIESVRRGQGKPNIIYVKNFATGLNGTSGSLEKPVNPLIRENHESRIVNITNQESLESRIKVRENHEQSILIKHTYSIDTKSESMSTSDSGIDRIKTDRTLTVTPDVLPYMKSKKNEKEPSSTAAVQSSVIESSSPIKETSTSVPVEDKFTTYQRIIQDNIEYISSDE